MGNDVERAASRLVARVPGTSQSVRTVMQIGPRRIALLGLQRVRGLIFRWRRRVRGGRRLRIHSSPIVTAGCGSQLELGEGVELFSGIRFNLDDADAVIRIGNGTYVNRSVEFWCRKSVQIGERCAISAHVVIMDSDYHGHGRDAAVVVGDRVWVGIRSTILKGVTIGDGATIAAGAMVTRDVPSGATVAGVPAKIVRMGPPWHQTPDA